MSARYSIAAMQIRPRRATIYRPYWRARSRQLAPLAVMALVILGAAAHLALFAGVEIIGRMP